MYIVYLISSLNSSDSPCSSSGSEWSPSSPLPPIEGGQPENALIDNPDRHMGPAVNSRLPKLAATSTNGSLPSRRLSRLSK